MRAMYVSDSLVRAADNFQLRSQRSDSWPRVQGHGQYALS